MGYPGLSRSLVWAVYLVLAWSSAQAEHGYIDYLYINSGEGSASGGHSAIQFEREVFHFQHVEPGLLRIFRDDFSAFKFNYSYLENRTIEGHRIEVADQVFQNLRDAFNHRFLIQNQQFTRLKALQDDLALLKALKQLSLTTPDPGTVSTVELKALGYFLSDYQAGQRWMGSENESPQHNTSAAQLKQAVIATYGDTFLAQKRQQIWAQLQALKPAAASKPIELTEQDYVDYPPGFSQRYQNGLLNLAALEVLERELVPRQETLLTSTQTRLKLDDKAISKLAEFRQTLCQDLIKLMRSERGDWGYPLLVGMARLHALDQSIQTGYLVVLDRCLPSDTTTKGQEIAPESLEDAISQAETLLDKARQGLHKSAGLDERSYNEIELAGSRWLKIQAIPHSKDSILLPTLSNTPAVSAKANLVSLAITPDQLDSHIQALSQQLDVYAGQLRMLYDYQLLSRNCVTEIFRVINTNLKQQVVTDKAGKPAAAAQIRQTSEQWLGGYIEDQALNIIPFVAFDAVANAYRVDASYRLSTYREQQIETQYRYQPNILVDLSESNTLSSTIYHRHGEDSAFLFFTQDAVWPRPLLGSVNLAVAAGQTLYGIIALPWDAGKNLRMSLKGMLVSVPELFFFNIRKGSFPQLLPGVQKE